MISTVDDIWIHKLMVYSVDDVLIDENIWSQLLMTFRFIQYKITIVMWFECIKYRISTVNNIVIHNVHYMNYWWHRYIIATVDEVVRH